MFELVVLCVSASLRESVLVAAEGRAVFSVAQRGLSAGNLPGFYLTANLAVGMMAVQLVQDEANGERGSSVKSEEPSAASVRFKLQT